MSSKSKYEIGRILTKGEDNEIENLVTEMINTKSKKISSTNVNKLIKLMKSYRDSQGDKAYKKMKKIHKPNG